LATRSTDKPRALEGEALRPPLPRLDSGWPALDPRLLAELEGDPWETSWQLTPAVHTPAGDPEARQRAWTLAQMLRPAARDAFALSEERTALDLNCGEGWLAHRLLGWGARRVVATDDRQSMLLRARLLRDHFSVPGAELELMGPGQLPTPDAGRRFDVVLRTGALDRAADAGDLADAFERTGRILAIECHGDRANETAEAALAAGFASVDRIRPPLHGAPTYVTEQRDLLIARVRIGR
jgi:SAM-dependent methyltransferase